VERYLHEGSKYAAFSFNQGWRQDSNAITSHDLLTLNFLGIGVGPLGYRELLARAGDIEDCLEAIGSDLPLWDPPD
jgi:hypothetical protein